MFDSKVYGSFFFKQPVAGTYGKPTHSRNSWNKEIHPDGEKKKSCICGKNISQLSVLAAFLDCP